MGVAGDRKAGAALHASMKRQGASSASLSRSFTRKAGAESSPGRRTARSATYLAWRARGFTAVIAGLYWYDESQLACERAAAPAERAWVEGFVLGNEGLLSGRYSLDRLATEIERLEAESGRPVTACEPGGRYLDDRRLLGLGDWIFPNVHP